MCEECDLQADDDFRDRMAECGLLPILRQHERGDTIRRVSMPLATHAYEPGTTLATFIHYSDRISQVRCAPAHVAELMAHLGGYRYTD